MKDKYSETGNLSYHDKEEQLCSNIVNMRMSRQWMTGDVLNYKILKDNAKQNRKNMTDAEQAFWICVKGKSLGQRCLRQHVIGNYIVDFLFCKSKIIVEIDGDYHYEQRRLSKSPCLGRMLNPTIANNPTYIDQIEEDRIRQEWLESMGYKVLRFSNEQVLFDTENTIKKLKQILQTSNSPETSELDFRVSFPPKQGD